MTDEPEVPVFETMPEVMARFKRESVNTIKADIKRGIVPQPRKIGGRNLFVKSEVDAALRKLAQQGTAEPA